MKNCQAINQKNCQTKLLRSYDTNKAYKNNSNYLILNQILYRNNKHKSTTKKFLTTNKEFETNNKKISNELKCNFTNNGPKMASKIPINKPTTTIISSTIFFCEPCTTLKVFLKIIHLNEKKSIGIQNIPIKFIKMFAEYFSSVLANIFNKCIQNGIFPSKLKMAKIIPIHNNGCAHTAFNYRQKSILSPFPKYLKI